MDRFQGFLSLASYPDLSYPMFCVWRTDSVWAAHSPVQ
jgi:hypothetical protein